MYNNEKTIIFASFYVDMEAHWYLNMSKLDAR